MALLTDEVRKFIGVESTPFPACEPVERGAVRRYSQAIMDHDPAYASDEAGARFGGAVAPPLFPSFMFRTPFGSPDTMTERANDPDYDGIQMGVGSGLPELPLHGFALLNGGAEVEFYRYARHGETVLQKSRYADIYERETKSGPMIFVIIETEYSTEAGELLMRARKTIIRRK
jgi:hypothetical protein